VLKKLDPSSAGAGNLFFTQRHRYRSLRENVEVQEYREGATKLIDLEKSRWKAGFCLKGPREATYNPPRLEALSTRRPRVVAATTGEAAG